MELEGFFNVGQMLKAGVYALVHRGVVVYVGKSKLMLGRIYSHRINYGKKNIYHPEVMKRFPKGMLFDDIWVRPCGLDMIDQLEYEMVNLYKPKYNQQLKNGLSVKIPADIQQLITSMLGTSAVVNNEVPLKIEGTIRRRV